MTTTTITKIQRNVDKIIASLSSSYDFFQYQMVPWLCESLWERFAPIEIQNEINNQKDIETALELFFQQNSPPKELLLKHPALYKHIEHKKSFYLENLENKLFLTEHELFNEFKRLEIPIQKGLNFDVRDCMKEKKCYEVEIASSIVGELNI